MTLLEYILLAIGIAVIPPMIILIVWCKKGRPDWFEPDEHESKYKEMKG